MNHLKWVWQRTKGSRWKYAIGYITYCLMVPMFLLNPELSRIMIDRGIEGGETHLVVPIALAMLGVVILRMLTFYVSSFLGDWASQCFLLKMRNSLYQEMQRKDSRFFDQNRTGDLMTAMSSDLEIVRYNLSYVMRRLLFCFALVMTASVYYFAFDWIYAVTMLAVAPVIMIVLNFYRKRARPLYIELRERLSHLSTCAQENIAGNRVVKAFANEDFEIKKFAERNDAYIEQNLKAITAWLKVYPFVEILSQSMTVISLVVGGLLIINGRMTFGDYWACNSLVWAISGPMRELGGLLNSMQSFAASCDRLIAIENFPVRITSPDEPYVPEERVHGDVELHDVSLQYDKQVVLDHVSLKIEAGQTVAIMGETGSGKTTLINMIARFTDPKTGGVFIDGVNVKDWDLQVLRHNIGMATQDVFLFSDTIEGNIAYGEPELPQDDVYAFAQKAAAHEFIAKMPEGYDTVVGERGVGLSGGQKQRIALARALALRPSILILDDTTSAVDMETEKYIQGQLRNLDFECTKIIIAQRISSVRHADKIVILREGRIAEEGTHEELLAKRGFYYEINEIQRGSMEGGNR